jgi:hypothetical protein
MTRSFLVAVVVVHNDDGNANDDDKVDCFSLLWEHDTGAEVTVESDSVVAFAMLPFLVFFEVAVVDFGGGSDDDADADAVLEEEAGTMILAILGPTCLSSVASVRLVMGVLHSTTLLSARLRAKT